MVLAEEMIKRCFVEAYVLCMHLNTLFKEPIELEVEKVFFPMVLYKKKRYTAKKFIPKDVEGNHVAKGCISMGLETKRRDWCALSKRTMEAIQNMAMEFRPVSDMIDHVREVIADILANDVPLEDYLITKGYTKGISEYKSIPPHVHVANRIGAKPGDRIPYVVCCGLKNDNVRDRAFHPDELSHHKVDRWYYIMNQIIKPATRLLRLAMKTNDDEAVKNALVRDQTAQTPTPLNPEAAKNTKPTGLFRYGFFVKEKK